MYVCVRCIEIAWMKYQSEEQAKKLEIAAQPQQTAVVVGDTPSSKASANASATANTSTERQRAPSSNTSFARASSLYKLDSDSDDDFESDSDNEVGRYHSHASSFCVMKCVESFHSAMKPFVATCPHEL